VNVIDYAVMAAFFAGVNHHYRCLMSFGLSVAIPAAVSPLAPAPAASRLERTTFAWYIRRRREVEALAATPDGHEGEPLRDPWYLNHVLWSALLLAVLLAVWWTFGLARIWTGFE